MNSVLLQEDSVQAIADDSFPVNVTVLISGRVVSFQPVTELDFQVEAQSIRLIGSGGSPREFLTTFTLSAESVADGYTFANPALKFFQGGSRDAGFRVKPSPDQTSAAVSLFNTKRKGDGTTSDHFSLLLLAPDGMPFAHDPSIFWEPPLG